MTDNPPPEVPSPELLKPEPDSTPEPGSLADLLRQIRNRVIAGVFVVLPVFITFAVIRWLYDTLYVYALGPIADLLRWRYFQEDTAKAINGAMNDTSGYYLDAFVSVLAVISLLGILFIAGMFAKSRLLQVFNWVLLKVPGIKTIYAAVSNVFNAVSGTTGVRNFKRVVLVEFPHPGMKAPAFVTNECVDVATNKTILCVYVPTTPVPTSGYMLMVPEDKVVPLNWELEETLQAIVSGGLTVPDNVSYVPIALPKVKEVKPSQSPPPPSDS